MITALILSLNTAAAAPRTVCLNIHIVDDRNTNGCALASDDGHRRECDPGNSIPAVGQVFELWDKDSSGGDDFIGTFVKSNAGRGCATFDWESLAVSIGEANPDVYVKIPFRVVDSSQNVVVRQVNGSTGQPRGKVTWRNGVSGDPDRFVAVNCTFGNNCEILPGEALVPTSNVASTMALQLMALDSVQHTIEVFGSAFTKDVDMVMPCAGAGCTIANSPNDHEIELQLVDGADDPFAGPHELGHSIMKQRFDRNDLFAVCGGSHSLTVSNTESCATSEGWANFVYAASWWNDDDADSRPRILGHDIEDPQPVHGNCSSNAGVELAVLKGFWDLADENDEAAEAPATFDDTENKGEVPMAKDWDNFSNGTGNRKDHELDNDGPNLRDYRFNNAHIYSGNFFATLLNHNCLGSQDDG